MAAAAMTPRESETAFIPFCFPGVILMCAPPNKVVMFAAF